MAHQVCEVTQLFILFGVCLRRSFSFQSLSDYEILKVQDLCFFNRSLLQKNLVKLKFVLIKARFILQRPTFCIYPAFACQISAIQLFDSKFMAAI